MANYSDSGRALVCVVIVEEPRTHKTRRRFTPDSAALFPSPHQVRREGRVAVLRQRAHTHGVLRRVDPPSRIANDLVQGPAQPHQPAEAVASSHRKIEGQGISVQAVCCGGDAEGRGRTRLCARAWRREDDYEARAAAQREAAKARAAVESEATEDRQRQERAAARRSAILSHGWPEDLVELVIARRIVIGMTAEMVRASWGGR